MKRIFGTCMCMGLVGLLATAAYGQSELRMGGSVLDAFGGNNIIVGTGGGNAIVFLVLTDTDDEGNGPVRTYQFALPCNATLIGGASGVVSHDEFASTACGSYVAPVTEILDICNGASGDTCLADICGGINAGFCDNDAGQACVLDTDCASFCNVNTGTACVLDEDCEGTCDADPGNGCAVDDDCDPLVDGVLEFFASPCVDLDNPDYLFIDEVSLPGSNIGPCPGGVPRGGAAAVFSFGAVACGPGQICYAMEFSYKISLDAHGDHGVTVQNPDSGQGGDSFIRAEPLANILFGFDDPGVIIRVPVGACCDGVQCIADGVNETECALLGGTFSEGTDCQDPAACECSNNAECDDGLACNGDETCDVGGTNLCLPGTPLNCVDTNDCTIDSCDDAIGCINDAAAADGDACGDQGDTDCSNPNTCSGGACDDNDEGAGTACAGNGAGDCSGDDTCDGSGNCQDNDFAAGTACTSDGNPCTADECDGGGTCDNNALPDGAGCDDGDACTENDECNGGNCDGPAVDCNDGNPCTTDGCDSGSGCTNVDIPNCDVPLEIVPGPSCVDAPGSCCVDEGTTLCVDITAANGGTEVCGAQIFLEFDTCSLQAISIAAGDYPNVLVAEWDNEAGTVTIAVGVNDGDPCVTADSVIATVCFDTAICTDCCPAVLIQWGQFNPQIPIKLTNDAGETLPSQLLDEPEIGVNDGPPVLDLPGDIDVDSDVGKCIATVDFDVSASDCGEDLGVTCTQVFTAEGVCGNDDDCTAPLTCIDGVCTGDLGLESGDKFPVGHTTFTCTTDEDCCGNTTTDSFSIWVSGTTQGIFDIQLSPTIVVGPLVRCIEFCFFNCDSNNGGAVEVACVEQDVVFGGIFSPPGIAQQVKVEIPCTFGQYDCASARDPLHTLRSLATDFGFDFDAGAYTGTWAGNLSWLIGGNLNGDTVIDIVDFGAWLGQLGLVLDPNTPCGTAPIHADINGDGIVDTADFSFILVNFFAKETQCCEESDGIQEEPLSSVRVRDLQREGLGHLRIADLNNDGWIDIDDMLLYAEGNGIDVPQQMGGGFNPQN